MSHTLLKKAKYSPELSKSSQNTDPNTLLLKSTVHDSSTRNGHNYNTINTSDLHHHHHPHHNDSGFMTKLKNSSSASFDCQRHSVDSKVAYSETSHDLQEMVWQEESNHRAETDLKSNSTKLKALRMFSSPARSFEIPEYYGVPGTRVSTLSDNEEEEEAAAAAEATDSDLLEPNRLARLNKILRQTLKRSQSLDADLTNQHEPTDGRKKTVTYLDDYTPTSPGNRLKQFRDSLNVKLKAKTQSLRFFNREYGELSIFNKLRKIKQFKDNLKRYKLRMNLGDNDSELNSSIDQQERADGGHGSHLNDDPNDDINRSFEMSPAEQATYLLQGSCKYWIGKDYCNFIHKDVREVDSPFKDSVDRTKVPRMPWHDVAGCVCGPAARDVARHFIQRWNYTKLKKVRNNTNYTLLVPKAYPPNSNTNNGYTIPPQLAAKCSQCRVQVLRSVSSWSAGISKTESSIHEAMKHLISTARHYIYIENQFFVSLMDDTSVLNNIAQCLYERILKAARDKESFKVYVMLPLIPGYEGEYGRSSGVLLHAITHYNNSSINGLIKKLSEAGLDALNFVCFFSLRTWAELTGRLVTELIYVHSKMMIVDDRACVIGSANINDRSLLGNRDSELAVLIEDTQFVSGFMNKKPCQVGRFCSTLRQRLFKEFLGEFPSCQLSSTCSMSSFHSVSPNTSFHQMNRRKLITRDISIMGVSVDMSGGGGGGVSSIDTSDPCSDDFYKKTLLKYAAQNTKIYDQVFNVIPSNYVNTFQQLKDYQKTAPLSQRDEQSEVARAELAKIKGYIVLYPNRFLCNEHLKPPLGSKEKLMPSMLWT
jgi:phosphatidylserine/phosphatidylglycerophosphate/cardiolipin synthase-like enzyme